MDLFPSPRSTPLPGGYMGKILRVDLTSGSMRDENLPEEPILKKFIGGQSLALYILLKELPLDASPWAGKHRRDDDRTAHRQRLHSRRNEDDRGVSKPAHPDDARPRRDQRLLGDLSQSRRLRWRHHQRRRAEAGLSLHPPRQARAT